jgi:hypothetical protein
MTDVGRPSFSIQLLLAAGMVFAISSNAFACDPTVFTGGSASQDTRISIATDCSFEDTYVDRYRSSADFTVDTRSGGPARNIGNGRIGQKILQSRACGPSEMLLFVDCNTAEALLIRGLPAPDDESEGLGGYFIKYIQAPYGPIKIGQNSTVSDLIVTAQENDLYVVEDAQAFLAGERKRDRYDFACGCKLYYPGSVAAGG